MIEFEPVDPLSLTSLLIQPHANGVALGTATGFVVNAREGSWLVTNHHVLTGRDTETGRPLSATAAIPDEIRIWHHSALSTAGQGAWTARIEALAGADGSPRWLEHPRFCPKDQENPEEPNIDIAVLPLEQVDERVTIYPLSLELAETEVRVSPGLPVFIIGYPFGRTGPGFFPIWKTGHVATDPSPYWSPHHFLVDATTRAGMSGSPVVFRSSGLYERRPGLIEGGYAVRLMGVYSGRIRDDAELGRVWHPRLIREIIDSGVRSGLTRGG